MSIRALMSVNCTIGPVMLQSLESRNKQINCKTNSRTLVHLVEIIRVHSISIRVCSVQCALDRTFIIAKMNVRSN